MFKTNLHPAMYMLTPNVAIAGQDFTAPAVVPPTPTTQQEALPVFMNTAANCLENVWNVQLW